VLSAACTIPAGGLKSIGPSSLRCARMLIDVMDPPKYQVEKLDAM